MSLANSDDDEKVLEQFKNDVARFSGQYLEYLIIVKAKNKNLQWRSSDKTWAYGAAHRYITCMEAVDIKEEQDHIEENK